VSAAITVLFLSMRAVMRIGGTCASGGPYTIASRCPRGIPLLMIGSIWGGLAFVGVTIYQSAKAGVPNLAPLAWPALFLALGYNFFQYGLHPPGDTTGVVWSWLICGAMFAVIGGVPLVGWLLWGRRAGWSPAGQSGPVMTQRLAASLLRSRTSPAEPGLWKGSPAAKNDTKAVDPDELVGRLERLAELRRRGDLTDQEFQDAKDALLRGNGS
jgi:hypothetical protein